MYEHDDQYGYGVILDLQGNLQHEAISHKRALVYHLVVLHIVERPMEELDAIP